MLRGVARRATVVVLAVLVVSAVLVAAVIVIAQRRGTGNNDHGHAARPSEPSTATLATCSTPTRFGAQSASNEIRGATTKGSLWGLAFGHVPPRAGDELKIVWRMTGNGPLRVVFNAPDGHARPLVFGPEAHGSSNYHRPGDEWGTGFRFATPGCWHIHLTRAGTSGDVWLDIAA
jgi:hypothetical protein